MYSLFLMWYVANLPVFSAIFISQLLPIGQILFKRGIDEQLFTDRVAG
jgi:hypothetical protein